MSWWQKLTQKYAPPREAVVALEGLKQIEIADCMTLKCRSTAHGTGRLLGRETLRGLLTWYVELYCPRCKKTSSINSAKIDDFGRAVEADPTNRDTIVRTFVETVKQGGIA